MTLLIVDDHPASLKLLHAQLEAAGQAVFEAHDSGALAAKKMGGALTVHSDGPGEGAIFTLELPTELSGRQP
jgi:CheY-like chemotaxis protein